MWADLDGFSDGFKNACTGDDGKQYIVPLYYYPWAVHYSQEPVRGEGLHRHRPRWTRSIALGDQMKADGIIPFALANDGKWPAMGTFDILNMRINGYDFHVSLMAGKEDWTSTEVKNVFAQWTALLPYHQEGANGRTWQEAAPVARVARRAGMYLARHVRLRNSSTDAYLDDLDFFAFPELNDDLRRRLHRRPDRRLHDGGRAPRTRTAPRRC